MLNYFFMTMRATNLNNLLLTQGLLLRSVMALRGGAF